MPEPGPDSPEDRRMRNPPLLPRLVLTLACLAGGGCEEPTTPVEKTPPPVSAVELEVHSVGLYPGETVAPGFVVHAIGGGVRDDRAPEWSTSDDAVATVDSMGRVTAVATGETSLVASVDGFADTLRIRVTRWTAVDVGEYQTCAIDDSAAVFCWRYHFGEIDTSASVLLAPTGLRRRTDSRRSPWVGFTHAAWT